MLTRFPALRNPLYRGFFFGQVLSMTGGFMQGVAISWFAYRISDSAFVLGLMGFCVTLPSLVVAPIAGVMGDRFSRRNILIGAQSAMALQAIALFTLAYFEAATVPLLLALALWHGVAGAVEMPTRHAIYAEMFDDKSLLPNAISLNAIAMNSSRMIGPAIGGLLIARYGEKACFLFNSFSFLGLIAHLFRLPPNNRAKVAQAGSIGVLQSLSEGVQYANQSVAIRTLLMLLAAMSVFAMHYGNLVPVLVREVFNGSSTLYGNLMAMVGIGSLLAAVRLALRRDVLGLTRLIGVSVFVTSAALMIAAWSHYNWLTGAALLGMGFCMIAIVATINVVLQSLVDDDKRARVMSLHTAAFVGTAPVGYLSFGGLAEHVGIRWAFTIASLLVFLVACWFAWKRPAVRKELRETYIRNGIISDATSQSNQ